MDIPAPDNSALIQFGVWLDEYKLGLQTKVEAMSAALENTGSEAPEALAGWVQGLKQELAEIELLKANLGGFG
jgi:hypothetical protein